MSAPDPPADKGMSVDEALGRLLTIATTPTLREALLTLSAAVARLDELEAMEQRARQHLDGINMTKTALLARQILGERSA